MMTTEMMNRNELNEMELEQVNGAGFWSRHTPNLPINQSKETHNYKLPELDVDNRPAITPPPFCPTLPQTK